MIPGFNTTDRTPDRVGGPLGGNKGNYFGRGLEFDAILDDAYIDPIWQHTNDTRLIKSHEWSYHLDAIKEKYPNDWILLVFRPDETSYEWWCKAGGFDMDYPNYKAYIDEANMRKEIRQQNAAIMDFAYRHQAQWSHVNSDWFYNNFGYRPTVELENRDILVTIVR